jgi:hypothetical protein
MLRVQDGAILLKGPHGARIFRRNANPTEAKAGDDIQQFLFDASNSVGQVA